MRFRWLAVGAIWSLALLPIDPAAARLVNQGVLAGNNFFEATGSRQQIVHLAQETVFETRDSAFGIDPDPDDAHLRTTGSWASLVIQEISPEPSVMLQFVSMPRQHQVAVFYEHDIWYRPPESESGARAFFRFPPGDYLVAIFAEPEAHTTAWLEFPGLAGTSLTILDQPSEGRMQMRVEDQPIGAASAGRYAWDLPREGVISGGFFVSYWGSTGLYDKPEDETWFRLTWPDDYAGYRKTPPLRGPSIYTGMHGIRISVWLAPAGEISAEWRYTERPNVVHESAWLFTWPFVTPGTVPAASSASRPIVRTNMTG